jgi:hypothetical protein
MRTELVAALTPLVSADSPVPQLIRAGGGTESSSAEEAREPKDLPEGPKTEKATDVSGMFACVDCARKFSWNYTKRPNIDPFCKNCKSGDVKSISPRASAIAIIKGQIPTSPTKREVKRIRFIRHHWRMRCDLKEYVEGLAGLLARLGFKSEKVNHAQNVLNELLAEVDHQQALRLNDYDGSRAG